MPDPTGPSANPLLADNYLRVDWRSGPTVPSITGPLALNFVGLAAFIKPEMVLRRASIRQIILRFL